MDQDPTDRLKNIPLHIREKMKADRAAREAGYAEQQQKRAESAGYQMAGFVTFAFRNPDGLLDVTPGMVGVIRQWSDAEGNTIYTLSKPKEVPSKPELLSLARTIQDQQTAFGALNPAEQARVRSSSAQPTSQTGQYSAYFRNERLKQEFQQLNKPRPQR